ncbi:MAG TPA: cytochrome c oxidase subunit 3 family protein [Bryobacteraceae bacterium]|nr:cytochrome c oxidase subunit 3 family protein [Bryobacteraceae bacterium]
MSASQVERLDLREQFDTPEQQKEASTLGMWIFLVTEVMFFGGAFAAYIVYRSFYTESFGHASNTLDVRIGAFNTAVLIVSSLTMVLAVHAAQIGARKLIVLFLLLTILFGGVFLGIKAYEWHHKWEQGLVPGPGFHLPGEPMQGQAQLFFSLYFAMTGLHALHMVVGVGILSVLAVQAYMGRFSPAYYSPVDIAGLYWHFVDIIWIFLFPLLYLINRHS